MGGKQVKNPSGSSNPLRDDVSGVGAGMLKVATADQIPRVSLPYLTYRHTAKLPLLEAIGNPTGRPRRPPPQPKTSARPPRTGPSRSARRSGRHGSGPWRRRPAPPGPAPEQQTGPRAWCAPFLPRIAPVMPDSRMSRSTARRATGGPAAAVFARSCGSVDAEQDHVPVRGTRALLRAVIRKPQPPRP
jgi:hypothetical protein